MANRALYFVLFVASTSACRAEPAAEKRAEARPTAALDPLQDARQLALMPTRENAAVDERLARLSALARANPRRPATFIELGRAWVWKAREKSDPGYYLNADACVKLALSLSPDDRLALDLRALVLLNSHRFKEAYELTASLVEKDPDSPMAWGSLSDALLELGELERAERAAEKMLDLKPSLPSYSRASYFKWLRGDDAAALELSRLALDAGDDPKTPEPRAWVLVQTAMLFWHRGDVSGADAGFEAALAAVADYPPALVGRGRVALARGESQRARELLERAYRQSPLVETASLLADARELAGDFDGARKALADAEKEGHGSDPRSLSSLFSSRNVRPEEALKLAERERAVRGDVQTEDTLAWALYRNGRFPEAKTAIDRALRWGTREARLLFHQGAIELALGHTGRGRALLIQALALSENFSQREVAEARRLLEPTAKGGSRRVAAR